MMDKRQVNICITAASSPPDLFSGVPYEDKVGLGKPSEDPYGYFFEDMGRH